MHEAAKKRAVGALRMEWRHLCALLLAVAVCYASRFSRIALIDGEWLARMVTEADRAGAGVRAEGAMLQHPNNTIQHVGVVLGLNGMAAHVYCDHPHGIKGQMRRARLVQATSAVVAACLQGSHSHRRSLHERHHFKSHTSLIQKNRAALARTSLIS